MTTPMKRREAREQAFILVFERSFKDQTIDEILEDATLGRDLELSEYAYKLACIVSDRMPWLDAAITEFSKKWKINRISRVALSILRLSMAEIDFMDDVPVGAAINEAVELAKKYGGEEDSSYVNGVLGAYARSKNKNLLELEPEIEEDVKVSESQE